MNLKIKTAREITLRALRISHAMPISRLLKIASRATQTGLCVVENQDQIAHFLVPVKFSTGISEMPE